MATTEFGFPQLGEELIPGPSGSKYTAAMIDRDWKVVNAQLAGIMRGVGSGIFKQPDRDSFKVTAGSGLTVNVAAGLACIETIANGPAIVRSEDTIIVDSFPANSTRNLFLLKESNLKDGRPAFYRAAAGTNTYDGGELLATVTTNSGGIASVVDRRTFVELGQLDIHALAGKSEAAGGDETVIWDSVSGELRKVAIATLLAGTEDGGAVTQLSQLIYNLAHPVPADTYISGKLDEIWAEIIEMQGGPKKFPDELSLLADLTSALAVGLFEVNPPAMLRTQMSALGRGFGQGQNSTPDVSPNTGKPNEAAYHAATGLITP